ncbi:diguanylate cyclase [Propionivibrio sp.]|uniref:diguanylate cyclase n=1 Tax=Propionivibrio sp. TaxID=2212460 RepID=UPI002613BEE8|nr:diguanylate cyclase [Propionivibrio sp.]
MQTFVWGEEFYTGVGPIDEQHHGLVDLFNRLSESLTEREGEQGTADNTVESVFSQLMDYAQHHFTVEQALMQGQGVDARHVMLHLKLHDDFIGQVRALWGARAALSNPAEVFLSFLTSWLCAHVLGVDQSMARQLDSIGRDETPERAFELELLRPRDKSAEAMIKALRNTYQVVFRLNLELISANRFLEQRVAARTAELQQANAALMVANQKLEVYAQTDGLLGIANRDFFDARLSEDWNRGIRERSPVALLMIDVDFFKNYNDHYGHQAGDACLQAVARAAAAKMVRSVDLLARYGGEEFVVVLPNTAIQGAHKVALSICAAVSALNIAHCASTVAEYVTVSIGVASLLPERQSQASQAVAAADQALYAAKQQGRNRVCLAAN